MLKYLIGLLWKGLVFCFSKGSNKVIEMSKFFIERIVSFVIIKMFMKRLIWFNLCFFFDVKCVFLVMEGFCGIKNFIRIVRILMISKI